MKKIMIAMMLMTSCVGVAEEYCVASKLMANEYMKTIKSRGKKITRIDNLDQHHDGYVLIVFE